MLPSFQSSGNVLVVSIQRLILMVKQFHFVVLLKFVGVAYQAHKIYRLHVENIEGLFNIIDIYYNVVHNFRAFNIAREHYITQVRIKDT